MDNFKKIPRLLSPAGSYEALTAAISFGADEVYFGGSAYNARINAKNFDGVVFDEAVALCRLYNVKSNITINTLVSDRELKDVFDFVYHALSIGADSFIVQDLGLAKMLKDSFPEIVLHASTQCACHNTDGAKTLNNLGFSRIVLARELSFQDIENITNAGEKQYDTEIFLHGALCVSHSGMCFMSSFIGGRSGNRGLCAQPCRLPYSLEKGDSQKELLSLKDLSLFSHIETLIQSGVSSLKIEGRMKSPSYVAGVTKTFRRLLDERRNATSDEIAFLQELFSRDGFTDSYFTDDFSKIRHSLYGKRRFVDKKTTFSTESQMNEFLNKKKTVPISMKCKVVSSEPVSLSLFCRGVSVSIKSSYIPPIAINNPLTEEVLRRNLSKLGQTVFSAEQEDIEIILEPNLFLSISQINELRRNAADELKKEITRKKDITIQPFQELLSNDKKEEIIPMLRIYKNKIENNADSDYSHLNYDIDSFVYKLSCFENLSEKEQDILSKHTVCFGVQLPPVLFDYEMKSAKKLLEKAKRAGAVFCEISNIGQLELSKQQGFITYGGIGLNIYNSQSLDLYYSLGIKSLTLSPELNLSQIRDFIHIGKTAVCVSGKLPVMVLESCVKRAWKGCNQCDRKSVFFLTDRKGYKFPVLPQPPLTPDKRPCRNIIYNSVSLNLLQKEEKLKECRANIYCVFEDI